MPLYIEDPFRVQTSWQQYQANNIVVAMISTAFQACRQASRPQPPPNLKLLLPMKFRYNESDEQPFRFFPSGGHPVNMYLYVSQRLMFTVTFAFSTTLCKICRKIKGILVCEVGSI